MGIDKEREFKSVNIAVVTISDTRTLEEDKSGDTLKKRIFKYHPSIAMRLISKFLKNIMKAMSFMECQYHISYSQFRVL